MTSPGHHQDHGVKDVVASWWWLVKFPRLTLSPLLTAILAAGSLMAALVRGLDYTLLPQIPTEILTDVEQSAPIQWWGVALVIGAMTAVTGWLWGQWPMVIFGHALLSGLYDALGAGLVMEGFSDSAGTGLRDGLGFLLVQSVVHLLLVVAAWREWDRARRR